MKRFESCLSGVLLLASVFATACRGQDRTARSAGQGIDPALVAAVDSMLPRLEVLAGLTRLKPVTIAQQS
ncbi:MAG TPA: hypothetical protein VF021_03845, partial [Longimicrobiales bacterium]